MTQIFGVLEEFCAISCKNHHLDLEKTEQNGEQNGTRRSEAAIKTGQNGRKRNKTEENGTKAAQKAIAIEP